MQQTQLNPNLMALLSAMPQRRSVHLGLSGQPIDPSAPTGLAAFYQMQKDRAQQLGQSTTQPAQTAVAQTPDHIWNQGYGTPGGLPPSPIAPQPIAPLHPAFNPHVGPAQEDAALGLQRQTARLQGREQFFGSPESTRAYYSGARPQVLAQMMGSVPAYQPSAAERNASFDETSRSMGFRPSGLSSSRMDPAPRVDRSQPIWKRLKDAGIY